MYHRISNADRAESAEGAMRVYASHQAIAFKSDEETSRNLIVDLMHLHVTPVNGFGNSFNLLKRGLGCFVTETIDPDDGPDTFASLHLSHSAHVPVVLDTPRTAAAKAAAEAFEEWEDTDEFQTVTSDLICNILHAVTYNVLDKRELGIALSVAAVEQFIKEQAQETGHPETPTITIYVECPYYKKVWSASNQNQDIAA